MRPSIKDVARQSGVSYMTVSRVINGETGVTPQTRGRVEAAIAALGYRPDQVARSLRSGRTMAVRLFIAGRHERFLTEPFLSEVVSGVVDGAAGAGYAVVLETVRPDAGGAEDATPASLTGRRVDGTILIDSDVESRFPGVFAAAGGPCVVLPVRPEGGECGWIYADFAGGSAQAVEHLLALGHRRIVHLAGPLHSQCNRDRVAGYERALAAAGIAADPARLVPAGDLRFDGDRAMERVLASGVGFTAVTAINDLVALGAMECLARHGVRVPDDVSVVGFDDNYLAPYATPPLTTIRMPSYAMGMAAVTALVGALDGTRPFPDGRLFPVELTVRASTAPLAGGAGGALA